MIAKGNELKNAYIENLMIWIVMFIGFVTFLFFTINYATIVRVKDNMDAISDFAIRIIATQGTDDDTIDLIVERINDIKVKGIQDIVSNNITCNSVVNNPTVPQVLFTTQTQADSSVTFYHNQLKSQRAVYNEVNEQTVDCTLTINFQN